MKLSHPAFLTFQRSPSQEPTLVIRFLSGYILRRDAALRTKGVYAHSTQSHPACWSLSLSTNRFHIKSQSPVCILLVFSLCSPETANRTPAPFSLSDNLICHLHQESQVPTVSTPANSLWFLPFPSSLQPQRKYCPSYSWKTLTPEKKNCVLFSLLCHLSSVWPNASDLTSLGLRFLIQKMRILLTS